MSDVSEHDEFPPLPEARLAGRHALITGASAGIGAACARALAAAGAHVTVVARGIEALERIVDRIRADGGDAVAAACDVTDLSAFRRVVEGMAGLHIFVNNAGTNRPAAFLQVSEEDFDAVLDINLRAAFFCAQAAALRMQEIGEGGVIINMSSQMGKVGGRRRSVYCASKHAIEGMTKAMALDLAELGIRVNSVCPTFVETPMTRPFLADEAFRKDTLQRIPLGRLGQVGDIAGAVAFLASDAAALMTGSSLLLDGGWTAQ